MMRYDRESRTLDVTFKGGEQSRYLDIPPKVYDDIVASSSPSLHLSQEVKDKYPEQRRARFGGQMDLTDILGAAVARLPKGEHERGLLSVLSHIEHAIRHLRRAQDMGEEEWFTDAVYRCNQAYEGSLKEAYRVLAGINPGRKTPYEIEEYLKSNHLLKDKVLAQLKVYRKDWRNAAVHDYNIDFDEDEAFLAIVNVSAFAKVLIDQIAAKNSGDTKIPGTQYLIEHCHPHQGRRPLP